MIGRASARRGGGIGGRLMIAVVIAIIAIAGYCMTPKEFNPVTQEEQRIGMTVQEEIALGLQSAPEMEAQFGGLDPDQALQAKIQEIGDKVVASSEAKDTEYPFEFHVLADTETVNAFALPGGQVFITRALLNILETEGELAGVLGHEVGHVVGRHSAEQLVKSQLIQGLAGAAGVGLYDPQHPESATTAQIAMLVGNMVNMKYGRDDELQADELGVRFMAESKYDPRAMIGVMEKLEKASGGAQQPEFMSTHPDPGNRIEHIQEEIKKEFPNGVPDGLQAVIFVLRWLFVEV
jgi:beta-barrel assembly-enhancing protease